MSDLPEPWRTWAERAGIRQSLSGIGEAAALPTSTVSRLIKGTGRSSTATISQVAAALRVSDREVLEAGSADSHGIWVPPVEAHRLDQRQREALGVIIRSMASRLDEGSDSDGRTPEAQKSLRSGRGSATIDPEGGEIVRPDFQQPPGTRAWAARYESRAVDHEPDDDEPR